MVRDKGCLTLAVWVELERVPLEKAFLRGPEKRVLGKAILPSKAITEKLLGSVAVAIPLSLFR